MEVINLVKNIYLFIYCLFIVSVLYCYVILLIYIIVYKELSNNVLAKNGTGLVVIYYKNLNNWI